ncbi:patatin-like phospholipase family protein [Spirosoma endophyticum]|uniref:Patatin-like phospholipase/acyl hydrolase n=1 Tax=Spirosoma endophyticum TaxID=662367 RepID=A0A1I2GD26_9BACT|nr:patatin-like phospholipase family protein [Spirosoma endophyticum]SFF15088.1 Patatin-like phospholipase/acyl hydrolase [Spirosoma endophyticum]
MAFRILSIDGGGARGVIPLAILSELEAQTGVRTADRFDLIAGTSTGGLIACGLTLKKNKNFRTPKYSAEELLKLYKKHIPAIFKNKYPTRWLSDKISNLQTSYDTTGLDNALNEILGTSRLEDCRTPIFVSSYDMRNRFPIHFTSREAVIKSQGQHASKNFLLKDICRATSAAPTYFPPFKLDYPNPLGNNLMATDCIDGGIFVNNPSLAAYLEVLQHRSPLIYQKAIKGPIKILSLGTGSISPNLRPEKNMVGSGRLFWAKLIIELMMQANSQIVDAQVKYLLPQSDFFRVEPPLKEFPDLDDSSKKAIKFWIENVAYGEVINDSSFWNKIRNF